MNTSTKGKGSVDEDRSRNAHTIHRSGGRERTVELKRIRKKGKGGIYRFNSPDLSN